MKETEIISRLTRHDRPDRTDEHTNTPLHSHNSPSQTPPLTHTHILTHTKGHFNIYSVLKMIVTKNWFFDRLIINHTLHRKIRFTFRYGMFIGRRTYENISEKCSNEYSPFFSGTDISQGHDYFITKYVCSFESLGVL